MFRGRLETDRKGRLATLPTGGVEAGAWTEAQPRHWVAGSRDGKSADNVKRGENMASPTKKTLVRAIPSSTNSKTFGKKPMKAKSLAE